MFSGYRTYLMGAGLVANAGLLSQGYISPELSKILELLLLGGGFAALRAGVAKK